LSRFAAVAISKNLIFIPKKLDEVLGTVLRNFIDIPDKEGINFPVYTLSVYSVSFKREEKICCRSILPCLQFWLL
jgi:hypothetical protein